MKQKKQDSLILNYVFHWEWLKSQIERKKCM